MRYLLLVLFLMLFSGALAFGIDKENPGNGEPIPGYEVPVDLSEVVVLLERVIELELEHNVLLQYGVGMLSFLSGVALAFVFLYGFHLR
jgi:hypothetical protein